MPLFVTKMYESLPPYWQLATLRCFVYATMVGWNSFQAGVEGYAKFSEMTPMQHWKLLGSISVAMLGVLLAFLDQTMSKAKPDDSKPQQEVK